MGSLLWYHMSPLQWLQISQTYQVNVIYFPMAEEMRMEPTNRQAILIMLAHMLVFAATLRHLIESNVLFKNDIDDYVHFLVQERTNVNEAIF